MPDPVVDVSSYQANVNWIAEKAAGVVMGIAKASEGTGWNDPYFSANWKDIQAAGLMRGAYHFGHPSSNPHAEVDHFLAQIAAAGGLAPTDHLWLDIETNDGRNNAADWSLRFMQALEAKVGSPARIGVYTGKWFIDSNGGPAAWSALTRWGLWLSKYTSIITANDCAPWSSCVLWQNTSSDRHPGVNGVCDGSIVENGGYFTAAQPASQITTGDDVTPIIFAWNNPTTGATEQFISDGFRFAHFKSLADKADRSGVFTTLYGRPPQVWVNLAPVANIDAFGVPIDKATADAAGIAYP